MSKVELYISRAVVVLISKFKEIHMWSVIRDGSTSIPFVGETLEKIKSHCIQYLSESLIYDHSSFRHVRYTRCSTLSSWYIHLLPLIQASAIYSEIELKTHILSILLILFDST
jgi:hypothetical protein